MDAVRISVSLERGLFLGAFFGVGISLIRLIVERFPYSKVFPCLAVATIIGGLIFSIGLFTYDILLVQINLAGMLFAGRLYAGRFRFCSRRPDTSRIIENVSYRNSCLFGIGFNLDSSSYAAPRRR